MAAEAFKKHEVVPDVLASNPPSKVVSVKFNSGVEVNIFYRKTLNLLFHF